jgi:carbon monoxide dehydrogenase subunit G
MELVHDFSVPVPADRAFELLVDVEKIAPCLPGAAVTSVDGDTFEGGMKIKLGPISMTFKGDGELVEKDATARRAVIQAQGRDAKGNGGAQATVTASLAERDGATDVHVVTDLNVTGKAAQFGGGVMKDVSNRMLAQFADNLSQLIQSGAAGEPSATAAANGAPQASDAAPGPRAGTATPPTSASRAPAHTFTPAGDDGLDAMGLLFGSDAVKSVAKPLFIGATGLVVGYLYGKNRTLERIVRSVF